MSQRIKDFAAGVRIIRKDYYAKNFPTLEVEGIRIKYGRKYAKIIVLTRDGRDGSVYCFINMENGDVLKAAGWKAPAKTARSNIWNDDIGLSGVGPYGANYLR